MFDGTEEIEVDDEFIDNFYASADGEVFLPDNKKKLFPNQYLLLKSSKDPKKSAMCRYKDDNTPLKKIYTYKDIWGLSAKNKEQKYAMDLLFDKDIHIISLTGQAGTGKTLIAAACGLEQVFNSTRSQGGYDKLIITRPVQPPGS